MLDCSARKVSFYLMQALIADDRGRDIHSQARAMIQRQTLEWFAWMDRTLDYHHTNFVYRQPKPDELKVHQQMLKEAIRTCLLLNTLLADPDFNEPQLASRLQIRIRQLQDAYDTFHDPALSEEQAEAFLNEVFPE